MNHNFLHNATRPEIIQVYALLTLKMHPKSKKQRYYYCCCCSYFFFIHVGSIIFSIIPGCYCQPNETCSEPFKCGGIRNISYPFWGSNRYLTCGYPGFELSNCQGNDVPLITLSSRTYRVLEIDYGTETLTVARDDLWNDTCPNVLYNTTLDQNLFEFPSDYNYKNVTLYYDCTTYKQSPVQGTNSMSGNNQFSCYVDGTTTMNFFAIGEASQLGSDVSCNNYVSVPVNPNMARALSNTSASLSVLKEALASGFSIHWLANNAICESCMRSDGICGYNQKSASFACVKKEIRVVVVGGASPPSPLPQNDFPGLAPTVESPGPEPFYDSYPRGSGFIYESKNGQSDVEKIVIGLVVSITGIIIGSLIIIWLKRRRARLHLSQEMNQNVENFLLNHGSVAPKRYNYSEIKKITKSFNDKVGQGGYGSVYKGMLPDGSLVAVKLLTETNGSGDDFINEVASISKTSHVNIVNLMGFCYERNKRALVYEFMPNQSLDKFISSNESLDAHCKLEWQTLFKIAVGVARGLEYLHKGCNTRIVHFDIKPQNILLDEDFCPKISDFGLAKLCKKKQSIVSMIGTRGTVGYIAPEVFSRNFGGVSHKSDVYSYGMMVLEMAGAKNIVGIGSVQSSDNYFPDKIYELIVLRETKNLNDIVNEEEEESKRKMFLVGFWCIQTIPSDRPSMSRVVEMLEGSLKSIQIPPKPFLFSPMPLRQEFSSSDLLNLDSENSINEYEY